MKIKRYFVMNEADGNGNDLNGVEQENNTNDNFEFEQTKDPMAQKILDELSKNSPDNEEQEQEEDKLYAGKYKTVDELKKGILNIGSELPDYVINGMSEEALEKYYTDLNKNFSSQKKDEKRKFGEQKEKQEEKKEDKKEEANVSKPKWSDIDAEFREKGFISDETYDKFEKAGFDSDDVDAYAEKVQTQVVAFTKQVFDLAGGQDKFEEIRAWAEDGNVHPSELEAIGKMPFDAMLSAMKGIKARYDLENRNKQQTNQRIEGNVSTQQSGDIYRNQEEYLKDVMLPKYGFDKRFQAEVDAKFKRSKL